MFLHIFGLFIEKFSTFPEENLAQIKNPKHCIQPCLSLPTVTPAPSPRPSSPAPPPTLAPTRGSPPPWRHCSPSSRRSTSWRERVHPHCPWWVLRGGKLETDCPHMWIFTTAGPGRPPTQELTPESQLLFPRPETDTISQMIIWGRRHSHQDNNFLGDTAGCLECDQDGRLRMLLSTSISLVWDTEPSTVMVSDRS